jgi:hypothetical protein
MARLPVPPAAPTLTVAGVTVKPHRRKFDGPTTLVVADPHRVALIATSSSAGSSQRFVNNWFIWN